MVRVTGLTVGFGGEPILDGIDLDVATGEFATLIGPSGSGKTSILRVVTGLLEPLRGSIELGVEPRDWHGEIMARTAVTSPVANQ